MVKRFRISGSKNCELRADFIDAFNSPQWGDPNPNINDTAFGTITTANGNRIIVIGARFNF